MLNEDDHDTLTSHWVFSIDISVLCDTVVGLYYILHST